MSLTAHCQQLTEGLQSTSISAIGCAPLRRSGLSISSVRKQYDELVSAVDKLQKVVNSVAEQRKTFKNGRVTIGLDSGAEISVWPPELCDGNVTTPSAASRAGRKYFGPGGKSYPSLPDLGDRTYRLRNGAVELSHKVHVVPVRKPLMAACDLNDAGFDIYLRACLLYTSPSPRD